MILSLQGQGLLFLHIVLLGMGIGFVFDVFRTIRSIFKHPKFLVSIEDILYWVIAVFAMFFYMLSVNDGEIRPFSIFGLFMGMGFYFLLPSRVVMAVSSTVVMIIKAVIKLFFEILFTPFMVLDMIFGKSIRKMEQKAVRFSKKRLHFFKRYVNIRIIDGKRILKVLMRKI